MEDIRSNRYLLTHLFLKEESGESHILAKESADEDLGQ